MRASSNNAQERLRQIEVFIRMLRREVFDIVRPLTVSGIMKPEAVADEPLINFRRTAKSFTATY